MRLLVADDDSIYRMFLSRQLSTWGYEVVTACDGTGRAGRAGRQSRPIVGHSRLENAGTDGVEVCRRVRANSEGRYIYLLLVTARERRRT